MLDMNDVKSAVNEIYVEHGFKAFDIARRYVDDTTQVIQLQRDIMSLAMNMVNAYLECANKQRGGNL